MVVHLFESTGASHLEEAVSHWGLAVWNSDLFHRCLVLPKYSDTYPVHSGSVFFCIARDAVIRARTRHILLQYILRNSTEMRNTAGYKMDARCVWKFVFFSSANTVLEIIRSMLIIVQWMYFLKILLLCATRLNQVVLGWVISGTCPLTCLHLPIHLVSLGTSEIRSLLLVEIAGFARLGWKTHLMFGVSREGKVFVFIHKIPNSGCV